MRFSITFPHFTISRWKQFFGAPHWRAYYKDFTEHIFDMMYQVQIRSFNWLNCDNDYFWISCKTRTFKNFVKTRKLKSESQKQLNFEGISWKLKVQNCTQETKSCVQKLYFQGIMLFKSDYNELIVDSMNYNFQIGTFSSLSNQQFLFVVDWFD